MKTEARVSDARFIFCGIEVLAHEKEPESDGIVKPSALRFAKNFPEIAAVKTQNYAMKRLEKKHSLAIRWFHWMNFPVLMTMIWSGILIYWANDVYRVGVGNHTLFKFFPAAFYEKFSLASRLGEGMAWHFVFGWIFAINGTLYTLYVLFSGEWRELLPRRETLREAIQVVLHDLRIRKHPLPRAKFNGAQRIAYTSVIFMGLGSLLTGIAIYKPVQTAAWLPFLSLSIGGASGYEIARWLHFWLTLAFCGFFLIHVAQVVKAGWNGFRAMITGSEIVAVEPEKLAVETLPIAVVAGAPAEGVASQN